MWTLRKPVALTVFATSTLFLSLSYRAPSDPTFPSVITRVDGNEDKYAAIQKAVDDTVPFNGGAIYLDGSGHTKAFRVNRPVILSANNVELYGRNGGSTLIRAASAFPPVILGMRNNRDPVKGTQSNCWVLATDLDTTVGTRYSLRTRKQSLVELLDDPISTKNWNTVSEFTVDFAFRVHEKSANGQVSLFGARDYKNLNAPMYCYNAPDGLTLAFHTGSGQRMVRTNWQPTVGALHRARIWVNLDAPTARIWIDDAAKTVTFPQGALTAGMRIVKKVCNSGFKLGGLAYDSYQWGDSGAHDTEFSGFKVSTGVSSYTSADTPARVDGVTITDLNRYFTREPNTLLFLPLLENAPADRAVRWEGPNSPTYGNQHGYGYFLRTANGPGGADTVDNVRIHDLWLSSGGAYGSGLSLSASYRTQIANCTINGGAWCVSSWPYFVSYPLTISHCQLNGSNVAKAVSAMKWQGTLDTVQMTGYTTNAITAIGCNLTVRTCTLGDVPNCEVAVRLLAGQAGGMYRFCDNTYLNFEGVGPSESYIDCYMETIFQSPQTNLILDGVAFANNGPTTPNPRPYVRLYTGNNPHGNKGSCVAIGGSRFKYPLAQTFGTDWTVSQIGAVPSGAPISIDKDGK